MQDIRHLRSLVAGCSKRLRALSWQKPPGVTIALNTFADVQNVMNYMQAFACMSSGKMAPCVPPAERAVS
jgi:hypothetical protein